MNPFFRLGIFLSLLLLIPTPAQSAVSSIDLGSEWVKVAVVNLKPGQSPISVAINEMSKRKSPALVAFQSGNRLIGEEAAGIVARYPDKVYSFIRDMIGKPYNKIQDFLAKMYLPYSIVEDYRGTAAIRVDDGTVYSLEELEAMILSRTQGLLTAAQLAGVNVLALINEHSGVALQYGIDKDFSNGSRHVVFYDMGSSSTYAALVYFSAYNAKEYGKTVSVNQFQVKDVIWDPELGGQNMEIRLVEYFADEFNNQVGNGVDVRKFPKAMAKLKKQVKRTKEILSANTVAPISVESLYDDRDFRYVKSYTSLLVFSVQHQFLVKFGQEGLDWRPKKANGAVGVGVWKEIWKESDWCWDNMTFRVGKGNMIRFWTDVWCSESSLYQCFPHLFGMAAQRNSTVEEMWDQNSGQGNWNLHFLRDFNDWELELVGDFLHILRGFKPSLEEDSVLWRKGRSDKDKAPGLDGFTIAVFQDCWDVIKDGLVRVFAKFHSSMFINQNTNASFIVLLPKKLGFLGSCVGEEGFSSKWRIWMTGCLSSVSYAILVNGNAKGWVKASRGLRQGDPLSLFLFTIVANVLSRMLLKAEEESVLEGFRVGRNRIRVTRLQFADDTIFFANSCTEELQILKSLLLVFGQISGLKVNLDKSNLFGINLDQNHLSRLFQLAKMDWVPPRSISDMMSIDYKEIGLFSARSTITREKFEELCEDLWERSLIPAKEVLKNSGLKVDEIYAVELIGGATRVPKLQAKLQEFLGRKDLDRHLDADEAIVLGAALHAANLSDGIKLNRKLGMVDGSLYGLVVELDGPGLLKDESTRQLIVPRMKKLPSKMFRSIIHDKDFDVSFSYENEDLLPPGVSSPRFAQYAVSGLADASAKYSSRNLSSPIKANLHFSLSRSGILSLDRADAVIEITEWVEVPKVNVTLENSTAASPNISVEVSPHNASEDSNENLHDSGTWNALSKESIAEAKRKLEALDKKDAERRRTAELKNNLEGYIYTTKEKLESSEELEKISTTQERQSFIEKLDEVQEWLYTDGEDATAAEFQERLDLLKSIGDPIFFRLTELTARPAAMEDAHKYLGQLNQIVQDWETKKPWLLKDKIDEHNFLFSGLSDGDKVKNWLEEKEAEQKKSSGFSTPAFTSDEVYEKIFKFQEKVASINRIPKPKPKIEKPPKKETENNGASSEEKANASSSTSEKTPSSQNDQSAAGDSDGKPNEEAEGDAHDEL
ncbi:Heat shock 70 kDa protein 17 [Vitis vinifera]|uniref:Heat shock 70 kDa protein 17 n=1 Tax=Vitis vinifera TaxID=29760 RepID=A0A438F1Y6_VITVI|nr:Heat shock 70 kDa protein 17 [Vitis vinifera]